MPAPTTADEYLQLVQKSGVVDERRLQAFLQLSPSLPSDPGKLAGVLVREGVLTRFQAEQFLQGKWRRFAIGNYKILERLGSGGMGNVYLCEHKVMRRRVAVKVLATVSAENPEVLKRFYREARAAAALDHPNIVRAHDIGQEEKLHFLVMDFVDGSSLEEIVSKHGPMDPLRAAHYVRQGAAGLHYAHEKGLIHRDIKPANLILDRAGHVKVLDMGVARFSEDDGEVLTKGPLGTADYLAPEQARDSHGVDGRADVYSLGASFYFLLTGSPPFREGKTVAQKIMLLQTRPPKPIAEQREGVPPKLIAVIDKMMAKDPSQRYQSMAEVVKALGPWTATPIPPPPDSEMPHLSLAAQAGEQTDVNLEDTKLTQGPRSVSKLTQTSVKSVTQVESELVPPIPTVPAGTPELPSLAPEPPPETSDSTLWRVIALSVAITAGIAAGLAWKFFRAPH